MQKRLSKGITKKRKTAPNKQYGDAPNPTVNKTLKIQYSDQRRIPEEGAEQIAEKEKEAQKEANEGTRRRHNLQSYNIEKIEFPEWKPFDNEDWSLTEPRRMRELSDYGINDPSLPNIDFDAMLDWFKLRKWELSDTPYSDIWKMILSAYQWYNFKFPNLPDRMKFPNIPSLGKFPSISSGITRPNIPSAGNLPDLPDGMKFPDIPSAGKLPDLPDRMKFPDLPGGIDFPELKKILLSLLKFNLRDLNDFVGSFPGLDFPFYFPTGGSEIITDEKEAIIDKKIWDYAILDLESGSNRETASAVGNIWQGTFSKLDFQTLKVISFSLNADYNSAIGQDVITIPFDIDETPCFFYDVTRNMTTETPTSTQHSHFFPLEYEVNPIEWRDWTTQGYNPFTDRPYHRPMPLPTRIMISYASNKIYVNEEFLYQTSKVSCNHKRSISGSIYIPAETPEWMEWNDGTE